MKVELWHVYTWKSINYSHQNINNATWSNGQKICSLLWYLFRWNVKYDAVQNLHFIWSHGMWNSFFCISFLLGSKFDIIWGNNCFTLCQILILKANIKKKEINFMHAPLFICSIVQEMQVVKSRIGFSPEFRVTVYVRKWSRIFFHFHFGKGFGNLEFRINSKTTFSSVNRKFP